LKQDAQIMIHLSKVARVILQVVLSDSPDFRDVVENYATAILELEELCQIRNVTLDIIFRTGVLMI